MKYTYRIKQDTDAGNPRHECDNFGHCAFHHRRYNLGDKGQPEMEEMKRLLASGDIIALPVYMYDHSGLTVRTYPFSCRWDSGLLGWIYVTKSEVRKEYGVKRISKQLAEKVKRILKGEIETLDQYLTGDVWGYIIEDENGEHVDSCWGFYGREYCEQEAKSMAEWLENEDFRKYGEQLKLEI